MKASNLLLRLLLEGERDTKKSSDIDAALKLVRYLRVEQHKKKDEKKDEHHHMKGKISIPQLAMLIAAFGPILTVAYLAAFARLVHYAFPSLP